MRPLSQAKTGACHSHRVSTHSVWKVNDDRNGADVIEDLAGKTAVVTGAASGIGAAMAAAFGAQGMRVMLADINPDRLQAAVEGLRSRGVECEGSVTDVGDPASVEALAQKTFDIFGSAHLVCNNAGVSTMGRQWELSLADWKWVVDCCLWGVINGVRSFIPRMLESGEQGHIVNIASMGGLLTGPFIGPYATAKHGVVGLSKGLRAELGDSNIGVSVVCPGMVATPIAETMKSRVLASGQEVDEITTVMLQLMDVRANPDSMTPDDAAAMVVAAVKTGQFWVLPNGAAHIPAVQADFEEMTVSAH